MRQEPPIVHISSRTTPSCGRSRIDLESCVFSCTIRHDDVDDDVDAGPELVREQIDRGLGIEPRQRRAALGDVDLVIEQARQLSSVEFFSNPKTWIQRSLPPLAQQPPPVWLDLGEIYDQNGIASFALTTEYIWDQRERRIAVRFGGTASEWFSVADTVTIGLDGDRRLVELRFSRVE